MYRGALGGTGIIGDHRGPGKADGSRWIQLGDTMRHERKQGKIWEDNLMNCGTSAAELQVGIFHCVQLNPTLRSFICYPPFTCSKTEKTTAIHSQASANETRSRKMACKTPWQADPVIVAWIFTPVGSSGRKQDSYCSSICTWHFDKAVLAVATCGNCVLIASAYWRALSKTLQKRVEITTKAHLSFQNPPIA